MILTSYNQLIDRLVSREQDPINRARFKMLMYCLTSNLIFVLINLCIFSIQGPVLQAYRALIAVFFAMTMLYTVYKWQIWRPISHVVCALLTISVWCNLLMFVQGVNIPTLQFVFLIVVFSFYVQGLKWGAFYSCLNVIPLILYTMFDGKGYFQMNIAPQAVSKPMFLYIITYNFLIIIFLHFHFFRAFNKSLIKVTAAKNHLDHVNGVLEVAMAELEKSSQLKSEFLSTMSHELRTPLNGVIGLSNVILMENPREDQKDNLGVLKFSAENLLSLINDILDLNKLESEKIELEEMPFYLSDLLKNSAGSLKINALRKGLHFEVVEAVEMDNMLIKSDPTRLTQVITNLVNNAVKFTETGYVRLETSLIGCTTDLATVRFSVSDSGIGIDLEKQVDIFDPFTQASRSTTRQYGGTGLGLAIVKKILKMFGSDIAVESEPGAGARFWFDVDFPYLQMEHRDLPPLELQRDQLRGMKVLVAEDNAINVMVITKMLKQWGIDPVIADNGMEAVNELNKASYDVILMDLHMPEMDGYQAARTIRQLDNARKAVPIIALTASVSGSVRFKVTEAGMNGYLSKPFNPAHLYEKLLHYQSSLFVVPSVHE